MARLCAAATSRAVSSAAMDRMDPLAALLAALLGLFAACGRAEAPGGRVRVFAAASLAGAFEELCARYGEAHPDLAVELHTAGTPQLVLQLAEGAPAEVFASADHASMERLLTTGRARGTPRTFARNRLAILTAAGNPARITGLADLAREDLVVVLCGPEVPAGRYARAALASAGVEARSASDEPSVRAALRRVALGEADAAIAYATDAAAAAGEVEAVGIPDAWSPDIEYPILALGDSAEAAGFVEFVLGPEGQAVLGAHGFDGP